MDGTGAVEGVGEKEIKIGGVGEFGRVDWSVPMLAECDTPEDKGLGG